MLFNKKNKFKKQRGQGVLEYALILILAVMAASFVNQSKISLENYLQIALGKGGREELQNPNISQLNLPNKVNSFDSWNGGQATGDRNPMKPVAFFSAPNPSYTNTTISFWDGSYDPDGVIVRRQWYLNGNQVSSPPTYFSSEGVYIITLEVEDNDKYIDTYTMSLEIKNRDNYTRLVYDHSNETRTLLSEGQPYNVGSATTSIIEHVFGKRYDLYNTPHTVIEQNYVKTTQNREKIMSYEVTVPVLQVTYNSNGAIISSKPYKDPNTGQQMVVTWIDDKKIPMTAEISTQVQNNTWTFYIYNEISSVKNSGGSYGSRNESVDYTRFYPEVEKTTQNPSFISSRNSKKLSSRNPGGSGTSSKCPYCTEPNRFTRKSESQSQTHTVSANGHSWSLTTHTRTHNFIDHEAYDWIYKYTGTGYSLGNAPTGTLQKLLRTTWRTEGWQTSEQYGGLSSDPTVVNSNVVAKDKYTSCDGGGWSESCWKEEYNTTTAYEPWYLTSRVTKTETKEVTDYTKPITDPKTGKVTYGTKTQSRQCTTSYYEREYWTFSWLATRLQSSSYVLQYNNSTSCTSWVDSSSS